MPFHHLAFAFSLFLCCPEFIQFVVQKTQAEMETWKELCMTYNATIPANCNKVHEGKISPNLIKSLNINEFLTQDTLIHIIAGDMRLIGFLAI